MVDLYAQPLWWWKSIREANKHDQTKAYFEQQVSERDAAIRARDLVIRRTSAAAGLSLGAAAATAVSRHSILKQSGLTGVEDIMAERALAALATATATVGKLPQASAAAAKDTAEKAHATLASATSAVSKLSKASAAAVDDMAERARATIASAASASGKLPKAGAEVANKARMLGGEATKVSARFVSLGAAAAKAASRNLSLKRSRVGDLDASTAASNAARSSTAHLLCLCVGIASLGLVRIWLRIPACVTSMQGKPRRIITAVSAATGAWTPAHDDEGVVAAVALVEVMSDTAAPAQAEIVSTISEACAEASTACEGVCRVEVAKGGADKRGPLESVVEACDEDWIQSHEIEGSSYQEFAKLDSSQLSSGSAGLMVTPKPKYGDEELASNDSSSGHATPSTSASSSPVSDGEASFPEQPLESKSPEKDIAFVATTGMLRLVSLSEEEIWEPSRQLSESAIEDLRARSVDVTVKSQSLPSRHGPSLSTSRGGSSTPPLPALQSRPLTPGRRASVPVTVFRTMHGPKATFQRTVSAPSASHSAVLHSPRQQAHSRAVVTAKAALDFAFRFGLQPAARATTAFSDSPEPKHPPQDAFGA